MKSQRPYPSLLTLIASTMSALPTPVRAIVGSEHLHLQSSAHSSTQKGLDLIKLDLVGKESLSSVFCAREKIKRCLRKGLCFWRRGKFEQGYRMGFCSRKGNNRCVEMVCRKSRRFLVWYDAGFFQPVQPPSRCVYRTDVAEYSTVWVLDQKLEIKKSELTAQH